MLVLPETLNISLLKSKYYNIFVSVGFHSLHIRPVVCAFDTGTGPHFIRTSVLDQSWLDNISQSNKPEIRGASDTRLILSGTLTIYRRSGKLRTRATFGTVDQLAVPVLLWELSLTGL